MADYKIHITDDRKVQFIKSLLKKMGLVEKSSNNFTFKSTENKPSDDELAIKSLLQ